VALSVHHISKVFESSIFLRYIQQPFRLHPQMVRPPPRPILLLRPDRDDAQRRASHASLASVATAKLGMDSYLRRKRRSTLPQILGLPPQAVKAS
jgi:hypothetical protein